MSTAKDGRQIRCDGRGCSATARLPVALRPTLGAGAGEPSSAVEGWLFVTREDGPPQHFCPRCARGRLTRLLAV